MAIRSFVLARFVVRRVVHGVALLVGVSVLSFLFLELAPGDFVDEMRLDPRVSPETVRALRERYGIDAPLPIRYSRWVQSALAGDFGHSFAYDRPVSSLLWQRARNTLLLTGAATLLAWLAAIPLGVWSAAYRGRFGDRLVTGGTTLMLAIPDLLLAVGGLWLALRTGWLPVGGMMSLETSGDGDGSMRDVATHLILPTAVLALTLLPVLVRHIRASLAEVLHSRFILAARARGVSTRRLLFRNALKAAANPLISLFGLSLASLLSASLAVEVVMSWPGLGPLVLEAVLARDLHVVVGATLSSTVLLLFATLVSDGLLYVVDPRTREEPA